MLKRIILALPFCITLVFSQSSTSRIQKIRIDEGTGLPLFVKLADDEKISPAEFKTWAKENLKFKGGDDLQSFRKENDNIGFTHEKFKQYFKGIQVEPGVYYAHYRNDRLESANGVFFPVSQEPVPVLSKEAAIELALKYIHAEKYNWEDESREANLKAMTSDAGATYFPKPILVYSLNKGTQSNDKVRLAWKMEIASITPFGKKDIYVDAMNGEIIFFNDKIHTTDKNGTAFTKYSSTREIVADSVNLFTYRLRETGRGGGIITLNAEEGTDEGASIDFLDSNNVWNNVNADKDEVATDAHWGAEVTYDFYMQKFNRDSYDKNGGTIYSYVHWDQNMVNAYWDGRMHFGDGGQGFSAFTGLDVVGHEFTHGVTEYSAGLNYQDESGALNESFSDIFGNSIEFFARPEEFSWLIGEDIGTIRSMKEPHLYGNPDFYEGTNWATGGGDNGGVHTNSGVQNFWYYLVAAGGSGVNENGEAFSVTGIGIDKAAEITYRSLDVYLSPTSNYEDAKEYSIQAAIDLYGECSPEMIAVMNAWHAVGLSTPFSATPVAGFDSEENYLCNAPAVVNFHNTSTGIVSCLWKFGDGSTHTLINPWHSYSLFGSYDVTLIVTGCNNAKDTLLIPAYVVIDDSIPCRTALEPNTITDQIFSSCEGTLLDTGGNDNYHNNNMSIATIAPTNALSVQLDFVMFDFVVGGDYIALYDGPDVSSPLIGLFTGNTLPNGGSIQSTGGSITIKETANGAQNKPGFEMNWSCLVGVDKNVNENNWEVFPNPVEDVVSIRFGNSQNGIVSVIDPFGRKLKTVSIENRNEILLNVNDLSSGVYFIEVESNREVSVKRIVVK